MGSHSIKRHISEDEVSEPNGFKEANAVTLEDVPSAMNEKKLLRRIDFFVMPWISILYALSLIDRTNIAAANVAGMVPALNLHGNMYSVALLSFFPTYIFAMIPGNTIVRHVGTKKYLSIMICSWGVVAMCQGFVTNFSQLVALRVLLGLFEGGYNVSLLDIVICCY